MEGPLRRKTLLKEGRKPAVSAEAAGRAWVPETGQPGSQPWPHHRVGRASVSTSVNWDKIVPTSWRTGREGHVCGPAQSEQAVDVAL